MLEEMPIWRLILKLFPELEVARTTRLEGTVAA
jgi:hypothetical protein